MEQTWFAASPQQVDGAREATRSMPVPAQSVPEPREPGVPDVHQGRPRLVVTRGPQVGGGYLLEGELITIGRDPASDIVIDDVTVSHHHAEIRVRDGRHVLSDAGSLNGTYLNRTPVDSTYLSENDEIWVGKARFVYRAA